MAAKPRVVGRRWGSRPTWRVFAASKSGSKLLILAGAAATADIRGAIAGLRLRLIQDQHDPGHLVWNRLIVREHPLGNRPLVGTQLRYLIECGLESDPQMIGASGLGPAAYHMACRDQWAGWSLEARQENRSQVIGLSRFLIRPGLRVPNLASQCYGLVLRQVADDWQERYGVRPGLVETYVDRERHQGRSLAAANWRRLGVSKGRGRDDQKRPHLKSLKDVWVYQLDPQARAQERPTVGPRAT